MPKSSAVKVYESDIELAGTQIMGWDGWRSFKMEQNFSEKKRKSVGEPGMPDRLYLRYDSGDIVWIEWKRLKGKAAQHQKDWHARERARGAKTYIAGEDFPATIDGFRDWYRKSWLMRHEILT
jgi:hypothetical protein